MKIQRNIRKIIITALLCTIICINGCNKSSEMTIETCINVFGRPHILLDDVCYYFSPWHPGSHMLKIHFKDNTILKYQSRYIDESDLHYYIPLLIEMLNVDHHNDAIQSLKFLISIFYLAYPNGYGDNYMGATEDPWLNTPLQGQHYPPTFDKSMYQKWKDWYNTEAYTGFENQKDNKNKDFY